MRSSVTKTTNHSLTRNSFLLSLALNLLLLLILSLIEEHTVLQSKESVLVEFSSLPDTRLQRRALITLPRSAVIQHTPSARISIPITRDITLPNLNPAVSTGTASDMGTGYAVPLQNPSSVPAQSTFSGTTQTDAVESRGREVGAPSRTRSGTGGQYNQPGRGITIRQPKATIAGSGDNLSGHYNISLVKYEDTSDTISTEALVQLALAMNRWTKIRAKVIKEPIMLDDPELLQVPMVYITSRRPFAFSERERENLRRYFAEGGFLLFSNAANSADELRGVANSIEFELWKILGDHARDLDSLGKDHQMYSSFFDLSDLSKLRGIVLNSRINMLYEDSGYGEAWMKQNASTDNQREKYVKLGVNIIVYALLTSPMVQKN